MTVGGRSQVGGFSRVVGGTSVGGRARVGGRDPIDFSEMRPYQRQGSQLIRSRERFLLGDSPGLGKSVQWLRALPSRPHAIMLCPASVLSVWEEQAERWRPDIVVDTESSLRMPDEGELVCVSHDSLPPPMRSPRGVWRLLPEPARHVWLGIDEGHRFKNPDAQRTQRARLLRKECGRCTMLTGTPMVGTPEDLWGVLVTLGVAHEVFPGGWDELVELCQGKQKYAWNVKLKCKVKAGWEWGNVSPEVRERLKAVMLRRTADEVGVQLPPVQLIDRPVAAPDDLRDYLDEVERDAWADVAPNELPPFELLQRALSLLAESRVEATLEWVEEHAADHQVLVFSAHLAPILAVGAMRGVGPVGVLVGSTPEAERKPIVRDFQAGRTRVLAMTLKTGGVGLNLQMASAGLFVDRSYSPDENLQALRRFVRSGSVHKSVIVARMTSDHPLDRRLSEILDTKERNIADAVGAEEGFVATVGKKRRKR